MFQFFFQSGEFIGQSNSSTKDIVLFIGNAIVQFGAIACGAWIASKYALRQYKKQLENEKLRSKNLQTKIYEEKLSYWDHLVSGAERFGVSLISCLSTLKEKLESDIYLIGDYTLNPWDDLTRSVDKVDRETLYLGYLNIIGDSAIKQIFNDLDTLNQLKSVSFERHNNCLRSINEFNQMLSNNDVEIYNILVHINPHDKDQTDIELAKSLIEIRDNYLKKVKDGPKNYVDHEIFLSAILDMIHTYYPQERSKPQIIIQLFQYSIQNIAIIQEIIQNNKTYLLRVSKELPFIETLVTRIQDNMKPIRNYLQKYGRLIISYEVADIDKQEQ